ncbi:MAG: hypothetical protein ACXQTG_00425 [Methanoculleaceae archaeon]
MMVILRHQPFAPVSEYQDGSLWRCGRYCRVVVPCPFTGPITLRYFPMRGILHFGQVNDLQGTPRVFSVS